MKPPLEILIADDHPIFRRGLGEVIGQDPSLRVVREAADGEQALQFIRELRPAVAVLDINMPRRSGLAVARALGADGAAVKIVLLTMHEDEDLLHEALNLGVAAYVLKENAAEDLLQAIHAAAAGRLFVSPSLAGALLRRADQAAALRRERPGLERLTPAERRILKLIAADRTTKEIAETLGISVRTVDTHRQNLSQKLGLSGSHSLLKFAYDNKARL